MKWYVGSDHAGFQLKKQLVQVLEELGDEVEDLGCDSEDSCDYPDFARQVGETVSQGGGLGLLVCGTGIGMSMTANKVPGVRAAVITDAFTGRATRQHNDANVACLGSRVVGLGVAGEALKAFRAATFEGGRHQRRVDKITALDGAPRG